MGTILNPDSVTNNTNTEQDVKVDQVENANDLKVDQVENVETQKQDQPKTVEYKITLQEPILEETHVNEIVNFAKENNFSNDVANKIAEKANSYLSDYVKNQQAIFENEVNSWEDMIKKDKDFGGEKFQENVNFAHQVINKFASQEFKQLLNETGYGNHPELFKFIAKIGSAMKPDSFEHGSKQGGIKKSIEEVFYGKNE